MNTNKAVTYSLLAHIRNTGSLLEGPIDIFIPLFKRVLFILNSKDIYKGKSVFEIKNVADETYMIDFPIPVIKSVLRKIANQVNQESSGSEKFQLFQDGSFIIRNYSFEDFEDEVQKSKGEIENLERLFEEFCNIHKIKKSDKTSILDFIDKNKIKLSKYLSLKPIEGDQDFTIEAQFVDFFKKIPHVYELIRKIYLGSIISSFLEYKVENLNTSIELLLDTNFIVSLLDLNTPESTHTCNKLIEIGNKLGYKFSILQDTIDETRRLLETKAKYIDETFLAKRINPEDIYNACERRNLQRTDLERIADNLEKWISEYGISIIYNTTKYQNQAKFSHEYSALREFRSSDQAALHDATAIFYVRKTRGKKIRDFEKVNCWFVNNSISRDFHDEKKFELTNGSQPELIKADELLNIIWLSNPEINLALSNNELIDIGLTSLVAVTLNASLPKASIIRELDDNIQKYASEELSDKDVILISTRIANRQLKNIQEINKLASSDKEKFVSKLKIEAKKQEKEDLERINRFNKLLEKLEKKDAHLSKIKEELLEKKKKLEEDQTQTNISRKKRKEELESLSQKLNQEKKERIRTQNQLRKVQRGKLTENELWKWRRKTWVWLGAIFALFLIVFLIFWMIADWQIPKATEQLQVLTGNPIYITAMAIYGLTYPICITILIQKYHNHSNIDAYVRKIKIPDDLKELEE